MTGGNVTLPWKKAHTRIINSLSLTKINSNNFMNRIKFPRVKFPKIFNRRRNFERTRKERSSDIGFKIFGKKFSFNKSKLFKYFALFCFAGLVFGTLLLGGLLAWYAKDLPQPDKIVRKEGFATKIFDRNDNLLYEVFADEKRIPANMADVPITLKNATIAIEDKEFYKHGGFDPAGYLRIVYNAIFKRRIIGGSTLTQQIVKNVLLSSDRTVSRKIKELVLAVQIERKYSKDEILNIYLNETPYGGTAWGIVAAAEKYFGKEVKDLNLVESAILAGMPQSPSYYSPYGQNPEAYKYRTMDVLRRMREDGYITSDDEKLATEALNSVQFKAQGGEIKAPHFVMYIKDLLTERYGENVVEQGGLTIKTTLDYTLHTKIQKIVKEEIDSVAETYHITNGAVMVMDPKNGQILSMVGSKDYFDEEYDGKFNVTTALRQPGSSIKPVTYVSAFRKGYTPETMIMDVKTEFPGVDAAHPYVPKNYDGKYNGPVSLRNALGSSLNIPAVKLLAMVGIGDMMQVGYEMGLPTFEPTAEEINRVGLSITLGGGEVKLLDLTTAYSAFANGGTKVDPVSVLEVKDRNGRILEQYKENKGKQVLTPEEAYLISHVLSDNNARLISFGPNSLLNIGWRSVAVKTGTTNDQRDNWSIGWTPQVIVGVWVGNNDNTQMKSVASGVSGASPIWRKAILDALEGKDVKEFAKPSGIESIALDKVTGYPAHDDFESKESLVIKGTAPTGQDPYHVKLKVCRDQQDKLAPPEIITKGEYETKEFFIFKEDDPLYGNADNHWQKGIDEWTSSKDDPRYKAPTQYCEASDEVVVRIESPKDHDKTGNEFDFKVKVGSSEEIEKVEFYANGDKKGEAKDKPYQISIKLDDGTYELRAKAFLKNGKSGDHSIRIGVNKDWDFQAPTPTPTATAVATATPTPVATATPTPTPKKP